MPKKSLSRKSRPTSKSLSLRRDEETAEETSEPEILDPLTERERWAHPLDSLFSSIGSAVATGNISIAPFLFFHFGGSAFLVPYLFFTLIGGYPLLYMELIVGQYTQEGVISVWKIVPILKGIGYCFETILISSSLYFMTPVAWCFVYLFNSFDNPFPWTTCENSWNTDDCLTILTESFYHIQNNLSIKFNTAGSEFFEGRVLEVYKTKYGDSKTILNKSYNNYSQESSFGFASTVNGMGDPVLELSLWMGLVFFAVFIRIALGLRTNGKLTRGTVTIPYAVIAILFVKGISLVGGIEGMEEFVKPNFTKLVEPRAWVNGAILSFFSLSSGLGVHLTIASHNTFHHDIYRDGIITTVVDSLTSFFCGLTFFQYLGYLSKLEELPIKSILTDSTYLLFKNMPDALGRLSGNIYFNNLYFSMIIVFIFDTYIIQLHTITLGFIDEFKHWWPDNAKSSTLVKFSIIALCFIVSLLCVTRGGIWVYKFLGEYSFGISLISAVLCENIAIAWIWGMEDLCNAAEQMTGQRPGLYLRICWKYLCPMSLTAVLVYILIHPPKAMEINGVRLPRDAERVGQIFNFAPVFWIPIYALIHLFKFKGGTGFKQKLLILLCPEDEHEQIILTGKCGTRMTFRHFIYFGQIIGRKKKVIPTPTATIDTHPKFQHMPLISLTEASNDPLPSSVSASINFEVNSELASTVAATTSEPTISNPTSQSTLLDSENTSIPKESETDLASTIDETHGKKHKHKISDFDKKKSYAKKNSKISKSLKSNKILKEWIN